MPRVGTALWNRIANTAEGATKLGFEPTRLDLHFLNKIGLKIFPYSTRSNVCGVDTVDHVHIFGIGSSVDLESIEPIFASALQRLLSRAGCEGNHRLKR